MKHPSIERLDRHSVAQRLQINYTCFHITIQSTLWGTLTSSTTHPFSSSHHTIQPATIGHVWERSRSLQLNVIFYSSVKKGHKLQYLQHSHDALEPKNSYSCHRILSNTNSPLTLQYYAVQQLTGLLFFFCISLPCMMTVLHSQLTTLPSEHKLPLGIDRALEISRLQKAFCQHKP